MIKCICDICKKDATGIEYKLPVWSELRNLPNLEAKIEIISKTSKNGTLICNMHLCEECEVSIASLINYAKYS